MTLTFNSLSDLEPLDLGQLIDAVEQAHIDLARGIAVQPTRHPLSVPGSSAVMVPMVAASSASGIVCFKLLVDNPKGPLSERPRQRSTVVAVRIETGECLAVLDGAALTLMRTAAASAVATRALARTDSHVLGLIGAGRQAVSHLRTIARVRDISEVLVWNRTPANAQRVVDAAASLGIRCEVVTDPREAVVHSDVVCTLTPAREPIVDASWIRPGTHINAVGAPPRPDHRDLGPDAFRGARLVVDSRTVALAESGAIRSAIAEGVIAEADVNLELGDVLIAGPIDRTPEDVTVFNSVGLPIQDLAAVTVLLAGASTSEPSCDPVLT